MNKVIIGGILLIVIAISIFFLIKFFKKKHKFYKDVISIDYLLSNERMDIPNCDIKSPIDGINYAISFKIKLNSFYKNFENWKHIFHKGTPPSQIGPMKFIYQNMVYDGWCDLVEQLGQQGPGLWLHPNISKLRLAFTTENKLMNHQNGFKFYENDIPKGNRNPTKELISYNQCTSVEYCDIDIDMERLLHLVFIVRHKSVDVYIDGKLVKTKVFLGETFFNNGTMYFDYNICYNGFIRDFKYIPYLLTTKEIISLKK